jgi:hypothetical protein
VVGKVVVDLQESQPVVHHLGRGTSDILLSAKSKISKAQLAADFFVDGTSFISRSRFSYVGGQAQVSVLKPGSDTICKALNKIKYIYFVISY